VELIIFLWSENSTFTFCRSHIAYTRTISPMREFWGHILGHKYNCGIVAFLASEIFSQTTFSRLSLVQRIIFHNQMTMCPSRTLVLIGIQTFFPGQFAIGRRRLILCDPLRPLLRNGNRVRFTPPSLERYLKPKRLNTLASILATPPAFGVRRSLDPNLGKSFGS